MGLALHDGQNWKLLEDIGDESVANLTLWCPSAPQQVEAWKQLIIYTLANDVAYVLSLKIIICVLEKRFKQTKKLIQSEEKQAEASWG